MEHLDTYLLKTLGKEVHIKPISKESIGRLPMFIGETYKLYDIKLMDMDVLIAELRDEQDFSVMQIGKHFEIIKKKLGKDIILVMKQLLSYNRARLINKKINFIIPDKQMYLPHLFINLKERNNNIHQKEQQKKLLPSAQFLLIYHILNKNNNLNLENIPFKEIAKNLNYTSMAISNAINNLIYNELIVVEGEREKFIQFKQSKHELWNDAIQRNLLVSPVLKKVYVDELPQDNNLLLSNDSAMSEYTNLNPSRQQYYAIEKKTFYALQKKKTLINANKYEGKYCLEVWKYNPTLLNELEQPDAPVVDPLSLYLSLKDSHDERIEMALEQIIDKNILW